MNHNDEHQVAYHIIQNLSILQKWLYTPIGRSKIPGRISIKNEPMEPDDELLIYDKKLIESAIKYLDGAMAYILKCVKEENEEETK